MRANVFTDAALARHAGRFVWLSINTEEAVNAAFLERVPIEGLPTLLVLDARTERPVLKWLGSANVRQLEGLLDDGERAAGGGAAGLAEEALARGDRLYGDGRAADAAPAYEDALRAAPPDWGRRPRTIESLVFALQSAGSLEQCARVARERAPDLPRGPSFANVAAVGLGCAMQAPEDAPWRPEALLTLEPLVEESLGIPGLLGDDRSGLYQLLVERRKERGDAAGAREVALRWIQFLEDESAGAASVEARSAFDSHRVAAALELGEPDRAIPALLESERDLPLDYNPPARLALLYREAGRLDDALASSQRALDKAYGPRKLRMYELRADLYARKGDHAGARRTLDEALVHAASLPASQRPKNLIEQLEKKAAELEAVDRP